MDRVLVLMCLAGCIIYEDTTHVIVRDVAAVDTTIRPYEPRYERSWIECAAGMIDIWCGDCLATKRKPLVTEGHELIIDGTRAQLQLDGDRIALHFDLDDRYVCGPRRGRGTGYCTRPALAIQLATPRGNVDAIRYEHRVSSANGTDSGVDMIVFGSVWTVAGALLGLLGAHVHEGGVIGSGLAMMAIGGTGIGFGVHFANAHDTITTTTP